MHLRGLVALVPLAVVALVVAQGKSATPPPNFLVVAYDTALNSLADTEFDLTIPPSARAPARVRLYVAGYGIDLNAPVGKTVGTINGAVRTAKGLAPLTGSVVVADPHFFDRDIRVQACVPGFHAAAWKLLVNVGGVTASLPLLLDPSNPNEKLLGDYRLVLCLGAPGDDTDGYGPALPEGGKLTALQLDFKRTVFNTPTRRGVYVQRVFLTSYAAASPEPGSETELRSLAPLPHMLTLTARYDRRTGRGIVSGRLTAAGEVEPGRLVELYATRTPFGPLRPFGGAWTRRDGSYLFSKPVSHRLFVFAVVRDRVFRRCGPTPSPAPQGCIRESLSPAFARRLAEIKMPARPEPR